MFVIKKHLNPLNMNHLNMKQAKIINANLRNLSNKCPFLSNKCPFLSSNNNKTTIKVPKITISNNQSMLFSTVEDILNNPLYPQRDGLNEKEFDDNIKWREGEPIDYSKVNEIYLKERIGKWMDPNSLENVVSNLIKTLEMEITNKIDPKQWVSMKSDVFQYKANNGDWINTNGALEKGTYNILMSDANPELFNKNLSFEESHQSFFNAFPNGFVWELLKVYCGPPKVSFTWRHWGKFDGHFNGNKGNGQEINVYGFGSANVQMPNDNDQRIRIKDFEVYYDIDKFLAELTNTTYNATQDAVFGSV